MVEHVTVFFFGSLARGGLRIGVQLSFFPQTRLLGDTELHEHGIFLKNWALPLPYPAAACVALPIDILRLTAKERWARTVVGAIVFQCSIFPEREG